MKSSEISTIPFPLYHGTTSYFLSEILTYGLGGKNIAFEWEIIEFFQKVYDALDKVKDPDFRKVFVSNKSMFDRILGSTHNPTGYNWRYGSVYLAVDFKHAARFSLRGLGSEIARLAQGWYSDLVSFEPNVAAELIKRFPKISDIFSFDHKPVVIQIIDLRLNEVATEGGLIGDELEKQVEYCIELSKSFDDSRDAIFSISFEYIGAPLTKNRLHLFNVKTTQNSNAFSFTDISLTPIKSHKDN